MAIDVPIIQPFILLYCTASTRSIPKHTSHAYTYIVYISSIAGSIACELEQGKKGNALLAQRLTRIYVAGALERQRRCRCKAFTTRLFQAATLRVYSSIAGSII